MTIAEWYQKFGFEVIAIDEARGQGGLTKLANIPGGGDAYTAFLTDEQLSQEHLRQGESREEWGNRLISDDFVFRPDDDIMRAVNWIVDKVAYSPEDKAEIIAKWKAQVGL